MNQLTAIVGAYMIGSWAAACGVCLHWLRNETVSLHWFLVASGWAGVGVVAAAITAVTV